MSIEPCPQVAPAGSMISFPVSRLCALAALLLLTGCGPEAATDAKPPPLVRLESARTAPYVPKTSLTGIIAAAVVNDLSFRIGGRVVERLVEAGGRIEAGQLLARLDGQEQRSDLRRAEASLAAAEAQLKQAQSSFERQEALLGQGVVSRRVFDEAERALRTAEAEKQIAERQLATAKDALGYTELRAPTGGILLSHAIEAGQVVQATQTVFTVAADGDRDAVFNVEEALVAGYKGRPAVTISLLSTPDLTAPGVVREVAPAVDLKTGTIRVKVAIPQTPAAFALGAPVVGTIEGTPEPAAIVPWQALTQSPSGPAVWIFDAKASTVSLRPVIVRTYSSEGVAISQGLAEGDVVVTLGAHLLHAGQKVAPQVQEAAR